jgi:hypothetical protein
MTQINAITATQYAADESRKNDRSYLERDSQIWRETLPYMVLLTGFGLASAAAAIADPLTFAGIFSAL